MKGDLAKKPSILGLCNPLLDVSAYVDQELLDRYALKPNDVILAEEKHKDLCKDLVKNYKVEYTAGGSAQNVMRVAAGIFRRQNYDCNVMFTGCIGQDEFGSLMRKKANEDGVITNYAVSQTEPTGTCAVCLTENGKNRSLCAFLGASQKFTDEHLKNNWKELVEDTDIIYISGFLMGVSPSTFQLLGEHMANCDNPKRKYCLNLSAPYVSLAFGEHLLKIMKYVDIVFGNDDEALAYAKLKGWETKDIVEIAQKIASDEKVRSTVGRIVVITRGGDPIVLVERTHDGKLDVNQFPCESIPSSEMVDTNGAGDSFAGGFLSQYLQGAPLEHCVKVGDYAAREIIKLSGIVVPDFSHLPELVKG